MPDLHSGLFRSPRPSKGRGGARGLRGRHPTVLCYGHRVCPALECYHPVPLGGLTCQSCLRQVVTSLYRDSMQPIRLENRHFTSRRMLRKLATKYCWPHLARREFLTRRWHRWANLHAASRGPQTGLWV